mgnify:CR=1 FL=1
MSKRIKPSDADIARTVLRMWASGRPPTLRTLAQELGYSTRSFSYVKELLERAEEHGHVVFVQAANGKVAWTPALLRDIKDSANYYLYPERYTNATA